MVMSYEMIGQSKTIVSSTTPVVDTKGQAQVIIMVGAITHHFG
jgi:hypothetical protein